MGARRRRHAGLSFARAVWRLVRHIPRARVATYGQIAAVLGRPGAARAVGRAMRACPADIPWHRVVNAAGGVSPRARVASMVTQRLRLAAEGVAMRGGRVVLGRHRWSPSPRAIDRVPGADGHARRPRRDRRARESST